MKKIALFLVAAVCCCFAAEAQVINLGNNSQTSVTGCGFNIYDFGGLDGGYQPNRDDYVTITSNDAANHSVQVTLDLLSFDVDCSDTLFIYDGSTTDQDHLLAIFNNCITDSMGSTALSYAATVQNPEGTITIRFKTDGSGEGAGFAISTNCVRPCQRVNVEIDPALSSKVPHLEADGWSYIDVCPGETLTLAVKGVYPDNGYSYQQSDATSTFAWDLSFEYFEEVGQNVLVYEFAEGRGYDVSVNITDVEGCYSYIPQIFRVRTSSNPIRSVHDLPALCSGEAMQVPVGYDFVSALQLDTIRNEQLTTLKVSDTIFLPDGIQCGNPPSCSYVSPVTFTSFSPTATIQSANDLLYVRISMEHSYIGDIWIKLTCPNQQYVSIMKKYDFGSSDCSSSIPPGEKGWNGGGTSSAYFGVPVDDSGGGCTPEAMGICWNYCWSNTTNQGYQYATEPYVYRSANITNNSVDSTNTALMTNVYHPDGDFSNLIGCPMNGVWSIEVMDGYNIDNGYICGWEIALDPALLPQNWSYDCVLDSAWVEGPGVVEGTTSFVPEQAGLLEYNVFVMDNLGCVYDTVTHIEVVQNPNPNLGDDFKICYGDVAILNPNYNTEGTGQITTYNWNTGDNTETIEVLTMGEYYVRCQTQNELGLVCTGYDTVNVDIYEKPVIDVTAPEVSGCAPLNVKFINNSTPSDAYFEWYLVTYDQFGNQIVPYSSTQTSPSFQLKEPGTYSIVLKLTTQDGCKDSLVLWNYITVNDQPIAAFDANPEISMMSESQGVVSFINYATTPEASSWKYYWDFGDGGSDSSQTPQPHTYTSWGDFDVKLTVESVSGCKSEISHTVVVEQDLIFPNVITPNGDNINDVFAIENLNTNINPEDPDGYRNNHLKVYDRWGKKVYDAKNYDTYAKDGQIYKGEHVFDGSNVQDGVYYYSFQYKGKAKTITFNGSITIIR